MIGIVVGRRIGSWSESPIRQGDAGPEDGIRSPATKLAGTSSPINLASRCAHNVKLATTPIDKAALKSNITSPAPDVESRETLEFVAASYSPSAVRWKRSNTEFVRRLGEAAARRHDRSADGQEEDL